MTSEREEHGHEKEHIEAEKEQRGREAALAPHHLSCGMTLSGRQPSMPCAHILVSRWMSPAANSSLICEKLAGPCLVLVSPYIRMTLSQHMWAAVQTLV